jgi:hypothetical protein
MPGLKSDPPKTGRYNDLLNIRLKRISLSSERN